MTTTAEAKAAISTGTAAVRSAQATKIAQYKKIDLKELLTYPDNHKSERVVVRGRIFHIDGKIIQIWVRSFDAVYLVNEQNVSGIYEDDYITVYGIVVGNYCFTNTLGNQTCQPALLVEWYEKK